MLVAKTSVSGAHVLHREGGRRRSDVVRSEIDKGVRYDREVTGEPLSEACGEERRGSGPELSVLPPPSVFNDDAPVRERCEPKALAARQVSPALLPCGKRHGLGGDRRRAALDS